MPTRDFSVMPVQVEGEPKPIERAVRRQGHSLNVGSFCSVEFGAVWADANGRPKRISGQWRQCRIVRHEGAIVHVVLDPSPAKAPPDVPFG